MIAGLVAINLFRLGDGVNADPNAIHASDSAQKLINAGEEKQWGEFITHLVPDSVVGPFVEGDILQVIFLAVLFGVALDAVGQLGGPVLDAVEPTDQDRLQDTELRDEARPAGRVRGDGIRDRQVRSLHVDQPGAA